MSKKIILNLLVICLLVILSFQFVLAPGHDTDLGGDDVFDSGTTTTDIDWTNTESFTTNFYSDPSGGFTANPDLAWQTLNSDPNIFATNPDMVNSAFTNDPTKAAAFLNGNPDLFKSSYSSDGTTIENENYLVIQDSFTDSAANDYNLLNDNPEARVAWLSEKYLIEDSGTGVLSFDGNKLTTAGEGTTVVQIDGYAGAKILEDGSVIFNRLPGDEEGTFEGGMTVSGGELLWNDDIGVAQVVGPSRVVAGENSDFYEIQFISSEDGGSPVFVVPSEQGDVTYSGDFTVFYESSMDVSGEEVSGFKITSSDGSNFRRSYDAEYLGKKGETDLYPSYAIVSGSIIDPVGSREDEFIIGPETEAFVGGIITVNRRDNEIGYGKISNSGDYLYYSESPYSNADEFCSQQVACMVNSPNTLLAVPTYRTEISLKNIPENQIISFGSFGTTSSLQLDSIDGTFEYIDVDLEGGRSILQVVDGQAGMTSPLSKVAKVDIYSDFPDECTGDDCQTLRQHWSSTSDSGDEENVFYQTNSQYFNTAREGSGYQEGFVTCIQGVDCTEQFAKNLGKVVIPEDGTEPKTLIVVSGDWPDTAAYLENGYCKEEGCYILHSRDLPDELPSNVKNVVVSGHHYGPESRIFNEFGYDTTCYGESSNLACSSTLPTSQNVETLTFSACHTVTSPKEGRVYDGFYELVETYPNVDVVAGWNGLARALDTNWKGVPPGYVEPSVNYYGKDIEAKSSFAQYQKNDEGEWGYSLSGRHFVEFEGPVVDVQSDTVLIEDLESVDGFVDGQVSDTGAVEPVNEE